MRVTEEGARVVENFENDRITRNSKWPNGRATKAQICQKESFSHSYETDNFLSARTKQ